MVIDYVSYLHKILKYEKRYFPMSSIDTLEDLIEQGRIRILPEELDFQYAKMYLEKFVKNFEMTFQGDLDVDLIFTKKGPFIANIAPSNEHSYIHFVKNREFAEESGTICSYKNYVQVLLKNAIYQIRYSYND